MKAVRTAVVVSIVVGACSGAGQPASLTITNDQSIAVVVRVEVAGAQQAYRFEPHEAAVVLEREGSELGGLDARVNVLAPSCEVLSITSVRVTRHEVLSVADPNPESKLSFGSPLPASAQRASPIADPCTLPVSSPR
jgi:hypothetical protein